MRTTGHTVIELLLLTDWFIAEIANDLAGQRNAPVTAHTRP